MTPDKSHRPNGSCSRGIRSAILPAAAWDKPVDRLMPRLAIHQLTSGSGTFRAKRPTERELAEVPASARPVHSEESTSYWIVTGAWSDQRWSYDGAFSTTASVARRANPGVAA